VSGSARYLRASGRIYVRADDATRKRINQAAWDGFDVDDNGVAGARLTDPLAALVADDVIRALEAESENHDHRSGDHGSRLTGLAGWFGWLGC
jgi:hypothetical protein